MRRIPPCASALLVIFALQAQAQTPQPPIPTGGVASRSADSNFKPYPSTVAPMIRYDLPSSSAGTPSSAISPSSALGTAPISVVKPIPPEDPAAARKGLVKNAGPSPSGVDGTGAIGGSPSLVARKGEMIRGIAKAYDGHSLTVAGRAVRLDGAEAPGLLQTCISGNGMPWRCGETAFRRLVALVGGRNVSCTVDEALESGAAAICSVRGISDVGERMVREGLAIPNDHDEGRYAAAASAARSGRTGLWIGAFDPPWAWRKRNRR